MRQLASGRSALNSRGIAHPRPYQINEYGSSSEQNPGDGSWYIARLERAGADGLRANWASAGNLHNDLANLLVRNSAGRSTAQMFGTVAVLAARYDIDMNLPVDDFHPFRKSRRAADFIRAQTITAVPHQRPPPGTDASVVFG
jgi:hypothetical protein